MSVERIRVEQVVKLFGNDEKGALSRLRDGATKDQIREETGAVLGLDHVSFGVNEGEILVVMGLSGSGKSTMLRCLNRLIEPTDGSIRVDGTEVTTLSPKALLEFRREKYGMVFQHFALFPNRSIAENVEYGLEVRGVSKAKRRERAMEAIELVGLKGWDAKLPHQLSGGMQQRAGLARALAVDADILLMDEAFSALDPLIRRDMQDELGALQKNLKKTIVFVSHDLDEAIHLGGRIVLMKDGAIIQSGYPQEILLHPADDYARRFVEHIDVSSVLTLGHLAADSHPALRGDQNVGAARGRAEAMAGDHFTLTCDRNMPVGRVSRNALFGAGSPERPLSALTEGGLPTLPAATVLKSALPLLADEPLGVAVVDDEGRFLGTVTNRIAIRAMAGQPAAPVAPAPSSTATNAGEPAWTGPSPNSRSTRSATALSPG